MAEHTASDIAHGPILAFNGSRKSQPSFDFDLTKPLFWQLWTADKLSVVHYDYLVHRPRSLAGRSAILFANPILEALSRTQWWLIPLVWLPVSGLLLFHTLTCYPNEIIACLFATGWILWGLVEYLLHRLLFHIEKRLPESRVLIAIHFALHGVHHLIPMDKMRLVFPPALAAVIVLMIWLILSMLPFPQFAVQILIAGGLFGYVMYDLTHYYLHHGGRPRLAYFRSLKSYHNFHHYKSYTVNYGITSKFWDYIFRTMQ
jgi:4-hydroxysphinganine ceramide fatty acyl 2-hydroxylase